MKILSFFLMVFIIGCSMPRLDDTLLTIDIEKAFENAGVILLSELAEEVEYIPLETLRESVTGDFLRVFATDKYIVAIAFRQNYLFDRKTGKFIREIGKFGEGPNEYFYTDFSFDEKRQTILSGLFTKEYIEYDLNGGVVRKIKYPNEIKLNSGLIMCDDNCFAVYNPCIDGNNPCKLYLFDDKGNVILKFPNYHSFIEDPLRSFYHRGVFYKWKNEAFFFEGCVDTLFRITKNELIPYYRFKLGKYNPPYSEKQTLYKPFQKPLINRYFDFLTINESDRFLFFSFWHDKKNEERRILPHNFGFYDKKSGTVKIAEIDDLEKSPVINDIDNFAPIYPFLWSVNQYGEMVSYMEAGDIIDWFEANPEKAKKLPKHLQTMSKLKIDDNPVIVIAKLKK